MVICLTSYQSAHTVKATFRTLASKQYWQTCFAGKGIIITVRPILAANKNF
jgi:hypothetical protein